MLYFSQTISHHLFQPQVTSNSRNIWCVDSLHLMGFCLLSYWRAETFHEGSNESLGAWTFVQTYISVSVTIAMCLCVIHHRLNISPKQQQSFWWIHLHIGALQVVSLHEICHEWSIFVFRSEESRGRGWYLSQCWRKVSIFLVPHLLHSNWKWEAFLFPIWSEGQMVEPVILVDICPLFSVHHLQHGYIRMWMLL